MRFFFTLYRLDRVGWNAIQTHWMGSSSAVAYAKGQVSWGVTVFTNDSEFFKLLYFIDYLIKVLKIKLR